MKKVFETRDTLDAASYFFAGFKVVCIPDEGESYVAEKETDITNTFDDTTFEAYECE